MPTTKEELEDKTIPELFEFYDLIYRHTSRIGNKTHDIPTLNTVRQIIIDKVTGFKISKLHYYFFLTFRSNVNILEKIEHNNAKSLC